MNEREFEKISDIVSSLAEMQDQLKSMVRATEMMRDELAQLLEKPK